MKSMAPLRLAILEADTPVPRARKKYDNYTGVFTALFAAAAAPAHLESVARVTGHHVVHDDVPRTPYPALHDVDAVLITGSKHNAYEDQPWILELVGFTRKCLDTARIRVVGVCFGHQIVARALGMKVGVNPKGWEVSVTETELSPAGKEFFGLDKLVRFRFPAMMGHVSVSWSSMAEHESGERVQWSSWLLESDEMKIISSFESIQNVLCRSRFPIICSCWCVAWLSLCQRPCVAGIQPCG